MELVMLKKRYFTLIEILVVCGIIAILAGMGFAGYRYAMNSGRESSTKALVKQISVALENCRNKFGFYPDSANWDDIVIAVDGNGIPQSIQFGSVTYAVNDTVSTRQQFFKHFISLVDVESVKAARDSSGALRDSWGNLIYYRYPGLVNDTAFDIISPGSDGRFSSSNEASPASVTAKNKYVDGKEMLCDDIANF